jgi:protein SCO1/2
MKIDVVRKLSIWVLPGVRALSLFLFVLPACMPSQTTQSASTHDEDISFPIADFTLTERSGAKISNADLRGKVWIASFVFTRCTGPCPQVTATMARLQSELTNEPDVRLITFTVDPKYDDPAELRQYALHFRADSHRWLFLTGPEEELHRLLRESFKVPVERNSKTAGPGNEYDHSTRLVVVDKRGSVRGYFQGVADVTRTDSAEELEANLKKLKAKITTLLNESP